MLEIGIGVVVVAVVSGGTGVAREFRAAGLLVRRILALWPVRCGGRHLVWAPIPKFAHAIESRIQRLPIRSPPRPKIFNYLVYLPVTHLDKLIGE